MVCTICEGEFALFPVSRIFDDDNNDNNNDYEKKVYNLE